MNPGRSLFASGVAIALCVFVLTQATTALADLPGPQVFPGQQAAGNSMKGIPILFTEYGGSNDGAPSGDRTLFVDTREYCQLIIDADGTQGIAATIWVHGTPIKAASLTGADEIAPLTIDARRSAEVYLSRVVWLRHSYTEITIKRTPTRTRQKDAYLAVYLTPIKCGADLPALDKP